MIRNNSTESKMKLTVTDTKTITRTDLLFLAKQFKGVGFASLVHIGKPSQIKTGSPNPGGIVKKQHILINWGKWRYGSALEAQAKREGKEIEFEIKSRNWGVRLPNSPLVHLIKKDGSEHYYIEAKVEDVLSPAIYSCKDTGKTFDLEEVKPYLNSYRKPKKESSTQDELEKKIIVRDYKISGVLELVHAGTKYLVKD